MLIYQRVVYPVLRRKLRSRWVSILYPYSNRHGKPVGATNGVSQPHGSSGIDFYLIEHSPNDIYYILYSCTADCKMLGFKS